tara:strand:- start:1077 stop:1364 length:288 start_codon:yes stop_codon:yes gene_type:complete
VEKIFENLWVLGIGVLSWIAQRLTTKIDALESDKASNDSLNRQRAELQDMDKKIDTLNHTSIGRVEYKSDIGLLHNRLNEKEDKIKTIRVEKPLK